MTSVFRRGERRKRQRSSTPGGCWPGRHRGCLRISCAVTPRQLSPVSKQLTLVATQQRTSKFWGTECTAKVVVVGGCVGEKAHALLLVGVETARCAESSASAGDDSKRHRARLQDRYGLALNKE